MSHEERDRRASFAQESTAQVAAVEAALRAAELNLEFTQVTSPIAGRVGRAIVTEGNLVSSGPGEATLLTTVVSIDPIYAYFDADEQIFLQLPPAAARQSVAAPSRREPRRSGWRWPTRRASRVKAGWTSSTTSSIAQTGTIRGRAVFRTRDGALTPGLFVRLRLAGAGTLSRPADAGPRRRHRPRARSSCYVVGRERDDRVPGGDARPAHRWLARRPQRAAAAATASSSTACSAFGPARTVTPVMVDMRCMDSHARSTQPDAQN